MTLTNEQQHEIVEYLNGTVKTESDAAQQFNVTEEDVMEAITTLDMIENCVACGAWCEICEMSEDTDEPTCLSCEAEQ